MTRCKRCGMNAEKGYYCEDCQWILKYKENKNTPGTTDFKGHMCRYADGRPNWDAEKYAIKLEKQRLTLKKRRPYKPTVNYKYT